MGAPHWSRGVWGSCPTRRADRLRTQTSGHLRFEQPQTATTTPINGHEFDSHILQLLNIYGYFRQRVMLFLGAVRIFTFRTSCIENEPARACGATPCSVWTVDSTYIMILT